MTDSIEVVRARLEQNREQQGEIARMGILEQTEISLLLALTPGHQPGHPGTPEDMAMPGHPPEHRETSRDTDEARPGHPPGHRDTSQDTSRDPGGATARRAGGGHGPGSEARNQGGLAHSFARTSRTTRTRNTISR